MRNESMGKLVLARKEGRIELDSGVVTPTGLMSPAERYRGEESLKADLESMHIEV